MIVSNRLLELYDLKYYVEEHLLPVFLTAESEAHILKICSGYLWAIGQGQSAYLCASCRLLVVIATSRNPTGPCIFTTSSLTKRLLQVLFESVVPELHKMTPAHIN